VVGRFKQGHFAFASLAGSLRIIRSLVGFAGFFTGMLSGFVALAAPGATGGFAIGAAVWAPATAAVPVAISAKAAIATRRRRRYDFMAAPEFRSYASSVCVANCVPEPWSGLREHALRDPYRMDNRSKEPVMNSTLDPDNDNDTAQPVPPGHDTGSLGPGDSSDSGSDTLGAKRHDFDRDTELDNHALEAGEDELNSDTDSAGTGERASADGDESLEPGSDVLPDRIEDAGDI
jgi:hypothetical protein